VGMDQTVGSLSSNQLGTNLFNTESMLY